MQRQEALTNLFGIEHQVLDVPTGVAHLGLANATVSHQEGKCVDFWGLGTDANGSFGGRQLGGERETLSVAEAATSSGEWTGIFDAVVDGVPSLLYFSDFFGFKSAYWSVRQVGGQRRVIAGNSFRAVLHALAQAGVGVDVDVPASVTPLVGRMNIFQTPVSVHTPAEGVWRLRSNDVLVVNRDGVGLLPRSRLFRVESDYSGLLRRGVEKACTSLAAVVGSAEHVPTLMLSGGKDSRTVLALCEAAGLRDRVAVRTHEPGIRPAGPMRALLGRDLRIASGLVEKLGLRWAEKEPRWGVRVPSLQHLEFWQKHRSAWNFTYTSNKMLSVLGPGAEPNVQLWGAGGELLRGYFSTGLGPKLPNWSEIQAARDVPAEALAILFDSIVSGTGVPTEVRWNSRGQFVASVLGGMVDSPDVNICLDEFYRHFRNAGHFGNRNMAWDQGTLQWYPLCQPEFVLAAEQLAPGPRSAGKTQFDIIESIDPLFNDWELESGPWKKETGYQLSRVQEVSVEGATERFWRALERRKLTTAQGALIDFPGDEAPDDGSVNEFVEDRTASSIQMFRERPEVLNYGMSGKFFDRLGTVARSGSVAAHQLLAKLETIRDVVAPPTAPLYYADTSRAGGGVEDGGPRRSIVGGWPVHTSSLGHVLGNPTAHVKATSALTTVSVSVGEACPDTVRWSVYLFSDSDRIAALPYCRDGELCIPTPDVAPTLVRLFFKDFSQQGPSMILSGRVRPGSVTCLGQE